MAVSKSNLAMLLVIGSIYSIFATTAGMLLLDPELYGRFSLVYAVYALGSTLALSAVSEAWTRWGNRQDEATTNAYIWSLGVITAFSGLLVTISAWFVFQDLLVVVSAGAATSVNVYRGSIRYRLVALGKLGSSVVGDAISLILSIGILVPLIFWTRTTDTTAIMTAWAIGGAVPLVWWSPRSGSARAGLTFWWHHYRVSAGVLVRDSAIAMINNSLMPYVLAPVLGLANFGIYRGIGNVTVVLRLIVSGLRPLIGYRPREFWTSNRTFALTLIVGLAGGGAVSLALYVMGETSWKIGTLTDLPPYAVIAGGIVAATGVSNFINVIARVYVEPRALLYGRMLTSAVAISAPLIGALMFGLQGALLGLFLERFFSIWVWRRVTSTPKPTT